MPTQTEKSRQSARLFLSSVTTDRDATNHVPIHKCPNPPGDETVQKPGKGKGMAVTIDGGSMLEVFACLAGA